MTIPAPLETHRLALLRLIAMLFEIPGLAQGKPAMLTRFMRGSVLYYLRPMESAARRMIVVLAQGLVVTLRAAREAPAKRGPKTETTETSIPGFSMFDRRKWFAELAGPKRGGRGPEPRIFFFDGTDPVREVPVEVPKPLPGAPVDATQLLRRLEALKAALDDLPNQAQRMARVQARRKLAPPGPRSVPPLRPGKPPGHRERGRYEIDEILHNCHQRALYALEPSDTS